MASEEISLFQNHETVVGAAWPYQTGTLKAAKQPVADTIPSEGATGWADSYLLATKAPHPNCAYKWMAYMSTPKPQAQQANFFGETPANTGACKIMDQLAAGSCAAEHADLNSYGWVDRTSGIARIPIDRAMQLVLERGLPDVGGGQTPLSLMQARPSETASPPRLQMPK